MNYPWPGNVRELENAIERAVVLCRGKVIGPDFFQFNVQDRIRDLPPGGNHRSVPAEPSSNNQNLNEAVEGLELQLIKEALETSQGNRRRAAQKLGLTERIMGYKVKKYGL